MVAHMRQSKYVPGRCAAGSTGPRLEGALALEKRRYGASRGECIIGSDALGIERDERLLVRPLREEVVSDVQNEFLAKLNRIPSKEAPVRAARMRYSNITDIRKLNRNGVLTTNEKPEVSSALRTASCSNSSRAREPAVLAQFYGEHSGTVVGPAVYASWGQEVECRELMRVPRYH